MFRTLTWNTCRFVSQDAGTVRVGVLYTKQHLLASSLPFLYDGDMIA